MKRGSQRVFGREMQQRKAFLKGLLTALVEHQKIKTTEARAKTLKRVADKAVTAAKKGTIIGQRLLLRQLGPQAAAKLVKDIAPRFAERHGGYTRLIHMDRRDSDGSKMAILEFVQ